MENLHLPIVRTHDAILMDDGVKTVDIHMIFANFRADENNPDNYWFKQTDEYLGRAVKDGVKIFFRLGESIEHGLVKYFVNPPEDFAQGRRLEPPAVRRAVQGGRHRRHLPTAGQFGRIPS